MKTKTKELLDLAIPATLENILQTLVGFIDTLMIAQLGLLAVSAVGLANSILAVYLAVFIAITIGTTSLVSRYLGARNVSEAKNIVIQSVNIAVTTGMVFGVLTLLGGPLMLRLMGADPQTLELSKQFLLIVGGFSIITALNTVFGSVLRASGDTKTPLIVNGFINILNVVLDFILIFGFGPIPALGVVGTAIGTVVSKLIGLIWLYLKVQQSEVGFSPSEFFKPQNYNKMIMLVIPATLERLVMRVGQVVYFGLIVSLSTQTYAAHMIAGNIESFTYMPGLGMGVAVATLVGNYVGRQDLEGAKEIIKRSVLISMMVMTSLGLLVGLLSPWISLLFTNDTGAIQRIVVALRIDMFIQPVLAIQLMMTSSLQAMGDTKSPLYSTLIGMWLLRVIGVYLLATTLGWDIAGVWIAILIDITLRAAFLVYKLTKKMAQLNVVKEYDII